MRRGLIAWSRDEVPPEVLEERVARLQRQMRDHGLSALLAYSAFDRPAAVSWLTHFVPYWNEALLALFPAAAPVLLAAFSKRMHPWIREVCHVGEIVGAPKLGHAAATLLKERAPDGRIGAIDLDYLPWSVIEPIAAARPNEALADATGLFAAVRQPADAAEIRLAERAAGIAAQALDSIPRDAANASEALAALERAARLQGAEEVILRIAPDLARSAVLRRMEGDEPLGARYALECSLAYKATWIRVARTWSRGAPRRDGDAAAAWLRDALATMDAASVGAGPAHRLRAPGRLDAWSLEACVDSRPLALVSAGGEMHAKQAPAAGATLPAGSLATLSVRLGLEDGPWLASTPLVVGGQGEPARMFESDRRA